MLGLAIIFVVFTRLLPVNIPTAFADDHLIIEYTDLHHGARIAQLVVGLTVMAPEEEAHAVRVVPVSDTLHPHGLQQERVAGGRHVDRPIGKLRPDRNGANLDGDFLELLSHAAPSIRAM
jgi:hypothetical protein